ncbi:MAG: CTP synthetase [Candidatus Magasanikbacteria bacterium GW2011_GWC2_40_17]|uniref:CTP synthase n=1 Tax=Candidatus Magasanikbacteria bacterium GW2011_GWA2_42_32 TaxID=1619039 RepID=A0A0G1CFY4_9BACT|nr:MAG: CTP synthetase [Candidatus Magasanikbacteria bacterium GW2011_GWC2_40_17]KKS57476.1 MAG: CTP synthetase [Candidatus Magasanikbacteria bacterium GW2011_GWA2_42_32]OGH85192.1 MAG: CTP synthase [Candidatus Magasanikbacteria bacterium RIFOXYB2_FULL_38_10]
MTRYIFVIGGVMSGVGKGTTTAAIGKILQSKGYTVTAVKIDPYVNVDAGTMNPTEHGEVFVTIDGDETDQDIGNYERFLDINITSLNYMTTGRVYQSVIERERNLGYGGRCVEVVPDVPAEVIRRIKAAGKSAHADFVLIETGGTVGEYQNILFLEAARMMKIEAPKNVLFALVSYLPIPSKIGEMKTKPTQYASRTLNSAGIQADFIFCRAERALDEPRKRKLAVFCNVQDGDIISAPDANSVYEVPINFENEGLGEKILKKFHLRSKNKDLKEWRALVEVIKNVKKEVKIAVVGKYFSTGEFILADSYISVIEAIKHASWANNVKPVLTWLNSEEYEKNPAKLKELSNYDGMVVPGGFGTRGVEGIIKAIEYARVHKIPYFGLCYGMQLATVEFARHVCGLKEAHTIEVDAKTKDPIIAIMADQAKLLANKKYGGSMRLGAYDCFLEKGTLARTAYGENLISERHRHRYEFNNDYKDLFIEKGMEVSGVNPQRNLVEIIELPKEVHPWFVGVQFHPEFQSRPLRPHPLFREFIKAALKK